MSCHVCGAIPPMHATWCPELLPPSHTASSSSVAPTPQPADDDLVERLRASLLSTDEVKAGTVWHIATHNDLLSESAARIIADAVKMDDARQIIRQLNAKLAACREALPALLDCVEAAKMMRKLYEDAVMGEWGATKEEFAKHWGVDAFDAALERLEGG